MSQYDPRYTIKAVKHPESLTVWEYFSDAKGRGGLYFFPKNVTVKTNNYIEVFRVHLLAMWDIHGCEFLYARWCHMSKCQECENCLATQYYSSVGVSW